MVATELMERRRSPAKGMARDRVKESERRERIFRCRRAIHRSRVREQQQLDEVVVLSLLIITRLASHAPASTAAAATHLHLSSSVACVLCRETLCLPSSLRLTHSLAACLSVSSVARRQKGRLEGESGNWRSSDRRPTSRLSLSLHEISMETA